MPALRRHPQRRLFDFYEAITLGCYIHLDHLMGRIKRSIVKFELPANQSLIFIDDQYLLVVKFRQVSYKITYEYHHQFYIDGAAVADFTLFLKGSAKKRKGAQLHNCPPPLHEATLLHC